MVTMVQENSGATDGKLILCIDDMPEFVNLIQLVLTRFGIEVIGANDGLEGLEKIRTLKPDLVLLDLMMPKMNGWEVYWRMQADQEMKDIPVIIVSVRSEFVDHQLALESAKANGYLSKPFSIHNLVRNVQKVLDIAA
ncbi:MAG: response regulator [Anaerolineae bacterium]|nr:response regulator [Anaerolineae bacterium]